MMDIKSVIICSLSYFLGAFLPKDTIPLSDVMFFVILAMAYAEDATSPEADTQNKGEKS